MCNILLFVAHPTCKFNKCYSYLSEASTDTVPLFKAWDSSGNPKPNYLLINFKSLDSTCAAVPTPSPNTYSTPFSLASIPYFTTTLLHVGSFSTIILPIGYCSFLLNTLVLNSRALKLPSIGPTSTLAVFIVHTVDALHPKYCATTILDTAVFNPQSHVSNYMGSMCSPHSCRVTSGPSSMLPSSCLIPLISNCTYLVQWSNSPPNNSTTDATEARCT